MRVIVTTITIMSIMIIVITTLTSDDNNVMAMIKVLVMIDVTTMVMITSRDENRPDRPTGAYGLTYIKSGLNWPI